MKKEDFVFVKKENNNGFTDYWFDVHGESKYELEHKYMEQSMIEIAQCVYSPDDDKYGIKRLFLFNYDVISPKNEELHDILKDLVNGIRGENNEGYSCF